MADLVQTSANVSVGGVDTVLEILIAGEALAPGNTAHKKVSDGKWYGGDASTAESAGGAARPVIVLTAATAADKPFIAAKSGSVNLGALLAIGVRYALSATAKAICPESDLATGDNVTSLGIATTTALLKLDPQVSGIAKP